MLSRNENLVDSYEKKLQACINILLASDVSTASRRVDTQSIQTSKQDLLEATHKLQQFFNRALIAHHAKNPNAEDQEEILRMQQEIKRIDELMAEKSRKIEQRLQELSVLKQKQDELA